MVQRNASLRQINQTSAILYLYKSNIILLMSPLNARALQVAHRICMKKDNPCHQ